MQYFNVWCALRVSGCVTINRAPNSKNSGRPASLSLTQLSLTLSPHPSRSSLILRIKFAPSPPRQSQIIIVCVCYNNNSPPPLPKKNPLQRRIPIKGNQLHRLWLLLRLEVNPSPTTVHGSTLLQGTASLNCYKGQRGLIIRHT